MMAWHEVERCRSPLVKELHGIWNRKRGGAQLPHRADFDPAEMKRLLPHLLIADLERDPFRARYRLVGTKVSAASGYDFTGRYLDEMELASGAQQWVSLYHRVYQSRLPLFGSVELPTVDGGRFTYEFGIFPLTRDGRSVNQCLELEDYGAFNNRLFELQQTIETWRPTPIAAKGERPNER